MKYVYLVHERNKINESKSEFCGIAYYTSYKKALEDFNDRIERRKDYEVVYDFYDKGVDLITHIREFQITDTVRYEVQLLKHEVY